MATFSKFQSFVEAVAEKKHDLGADQLMVALTNTLPVNTHTVLADITQISYSNLSTRVITTTSSAQTSGTYKLVLADLTLTASGGAVATFRYVVIYNNTATNKELLGWADYGSGVTLADTNTFTVDFDGTNGVLTIA